MKGFCVCCGEYKTIDPEDDHCWPCSSGRCNGEHSESEALAASEDHDPDGDERPDLRDEGGTEQWLRA